MLIAIAVSGLVLGGVLVWFNSLEARGERHVIFAVLVVTLLVEAILAGPASEVPVGLLRPRIINQDFRPPDLVIVAALTVRLLHGAGRELSRLAMFWSAFIALYVAGVGVGVLQGLPVIEVLFQGKGAFYLVGGITIASGCEPRRVASDITKLGVALALLVPVAFVIDAGKIDLSLSTPVQRFNRLGNLSNDSVTLLTMVGAAMLIIELTRDERRLKIALAAMLLLFAPLAGRQRASYLVLMAIAAVFALLILGSTWKRRSGATGVEIGLFLLGLFGLAVAGIAFTASPAAILEPVQDTFGGDADARSAQARVGLYSQAIDRIAESPIVGNGVGTKVIRIAERSNQSTTAAAHNIVLDVAMRIGLVGLATYVAAIAATLLEARRLWRRAPQNWVAAVAIAGSLLVVGTTAKGMVEPALDKFRLSLALGLGVGLVIAAARASLQDSADETVLEDATNA